MFLKHSQSFLPVLLFLVVHVVSLSEKSVLHLSAIPLRRTRIDTFLVLLPQALMNPVHLSLLLLSVSVGLGWPVTQSKDLSSTHEFHVGVILDMSTWVGKVSWSCILMAADDFYELNSNQNTKLAFHLKDSDEDVVSAALSAYDFITNAQIQVLIGPQTSGASRFVAELGSKFQMPVISFTSTNPSLSSPRTPYFIPTAINDSVQAKAIAALVQAFKWKEAILLLEDSDYGDGIVPYLTDAFQHINTLIAYKLVISISSTKKKIIQELDVFKNMQTKVFIVHASHELVSRIFLAAKEAEMMTEGYAWIITYGITDYLNLMDPMAIDAMQGALSLNPYVPQSKQLDEFKANWKKFYNEKNTSSLKLDQPGVFGLWAYDTVWALAKAAEIVYGMHKSSFPSSNGAELVDLLLSNTINLSGVCGNFHFFNRSREAIAFEIVNVIGNRKKRIGFWTLAQGISKSLNYKAALTNILWPGDSIHTPKSSEKQGSQKKLRIGIPVKNGFNELVNYEWNPYTFRNGSGFCIRVFDMVMASLPYAVEYDYVPYIDGEGQMKGTYEDLIHEVYLQNFDAAVGDIIITQNRSHYVDFTVPYSELGWSVVIPIEKERVRDVWIFVKPLTTNLWLVSGSLFVCTAFVVWSMEHRINSQFRGPVISQLNTTLQYLTMYFADSEKVTSNLTKVVVFVWMFVVFILTSSYTASLSSMLTVQQLEPLIRDVRNFSAELKIADTFKLETYSSPEEYDDILSRGNSNGGTTAIIDQTPYIKIFVSHYCGKYDVIDLFNKSSGFGFVFPKGSLLANDISREILRFPGDIKNIFYADFKACPSNSNTAPTRLDLKSFMGPFIIAVITFLLALLIFVSRFIHSRFRSLHEAGDRRSIWRKLLVIAGSFFKKELRPN